METPITVEIEMHAYQWTGWQELDQILAGKQKPMVLATAPEHNTDTNFCYLGAARVSVTLAPKDEIIAGQVDSLRRQLQTVRTENQLRENAILDQIGKLQALEFTPASN